MRSLSVIALLGCFGWMAVLALRDTGFDRLMFAAMYSWIERQGFRGAKAPA